MGSQGPWSALLVDFGGVLTTPMHDSVAVFADEIGMDLGDFARVALQAYGGTGDQLVVDLETGRLGEDEFAVAMARRLSEACGAEVPAEGLLGRIFGSLRIEQDMVEAVRNARAAGIKTGLLSNSWGRGGYPRDLLAEVFDDVVISAEVGLRKPDPEIFHLAARRLAVSPASCIFVDDHGGHLEAAAAVGMRPLLHSVPADTIAALEGLFGTPLGGGSGRSRTGPV